MQQSFWPASIMLLVLSSCGVGISTGPAEPAPSCVSDSSCVLKVQWDAPESNGANITGYRVYYGQQSSAAPDFTAWSNRVDAVGVDNLTATINGLGNSTYYVVITAYNDVNGTIYESAPSTELVVYAGELRNAPNGILVLKMK